jgi:hypothetical protein
VTVLTSSVYFAVVVLASDVLLHAATGLENWTFVKIPAGNSVLHLLRITKGCTAGIRGARAVLQGMEVPRGAETVVQASGTFGWSGNFIERVTTILVL